MRTVETRVGLLVLFSLALLFYMGLRIGTFRLNSHDYCSYTLKLNSSVGLSSKSEVKIAGVKVGWVEGVSLADDHRANVLILIERPFTLYENAQAVVRQDGLLGQKYIELIPGDASHSPLVAGATVQKGNEPVVMEEMMHQFKTIAENMASITQSLNTLLDRNQGAIEQALHTSTELVEQVDAQILPSWRALSDKVCDGLGSVHSIAQKIDEGTGLVGKLVNDDELYRDIQLAAQGARTYINKLERTEIIFDSHSERMFSCAADFCGKDAKGYFEVRLHTSEDYFYLLQIVSSERGFLSRSERFFTYFDPKTGCIIDPNQLNLTDEAQLRFIFPREKDRFKRNSFRVGLQFCKVFYRLFALRFGMIEGTGGVALDIDIPLIPDYLRWICTFEAFDFHGSNRLCDRSPHLKWLNRIFFVRNLYITVGADDFVSKDNKSFFIGAGVRFSDDDVKYVASLASGIGLGTVVA